MKHVLIFLLGLSLAGSTQAFAPFSWASNKYRYRASVCRASLNAVVRSLTKKTTVKTCMASALSALRQKNSLLERHFDVRYDGNNKKTRSYDPALKNILMYNLSRRLGVAYLDEYPFYSPLKVSDGGRAKGDFTLKVGQFCRFSSNIQGNAPGAGNVKRLLSTLSQIDFYGILESYRYVLLQGRSLQKKDKSVRAAYKRLRRWRPKLLGTMHQLISLRRHLENKHHKRHTPKISTSLQVLMKDSRWVLDYARIKVAALQSAPCQRDPRVCRRNFAAMDQMAAAVQSIEDLKPYCKVNSSRAPG